MQNYGAFNADQQPGSIRDIQGPPTVKPEFGGIADMIEAEQPGKQGSPAPSGNGSSRDLPPVAKALVERLNRN